MRRWAIFNAVGAIGFLVQLGVLQMLMHVGTPYLGATALAVEAAVLHNFVWHERWTWRERAATGGGRARRFLRFQALNGVISLLGNILIVWALVRGGGLAPGPANTLSVGICALLNFVASDRLVFLGPNFSTSSRALHDFSARTLLSWGPWPS